MYLVRLGACCFFVLICFGVSIAQRPGPEFWRKLSCEPVEPRTKLEALEERYNSIVLRGFTRITTLEVRGVRVDAVEMREMGNVARAKGVIVVLSEEGRTRDNRAFVDYEELDPLLNAIDALSKVDETTTRLAGFEAHYRTQGDLEIRVFRQTRSLNAVQIETGLCEPARTSISLDELAKLRAMILEAKTRLEELK